MRTRYFDMLHGTVESYYTLNSIPYIKFREAAESDKVSIAHARTRALGRHAVRIFYALRVCVSVDWLEMYSTGFVMFFDVIFANSIIL